MPEHASFKSQVRFIVDDFRRRFFVRRVDAGEYLEIFLVAAVASVLAIRLFLELTNYPQIGGGGLHIAHLLWGGLLMFVALAIVLCLMGRAAERIAAVLGGLGFGTFIDEIGKFVTSDNDYFYRPAVSLIYVCFVLIFLLLRAVRFRATAFTTNENFINALREMEEVVMRDLDADERKRALKLLERSDTANPLVVKLKEFLSDAETRPAPNPGVVARVKNFSIKVYEYAAASSWFASCVVLFFIGQIAVKSVYVFALVFLYGFGWNEILDWRIVGRVANRLLDLSFVDWIEIAFSILSGLLVAFGIVEIIRRHRHAAFVYFTRAMLIEIFIVQVFAFYKEQFTALFGLFLNISIYIALRFLIQQEERRASENPAP